MLSLRFLTAIGFASDAFYLIHENLMIATLIKLNVHVCDDADADSSGHRAVLYRVVY